MEEIVLACRAVRGLGEALGQPVEKLNMGALGNVTRQLHIHVVGRRRDDAAWPGPVWGVSGAVGYSAADLARMSAMVRASLSLLSVGSPGPPAVPG
jgi:diadenosine tetraphosphate (Ap4A) HIT family hydrolase